MTADDWDRVYQHPIVAAADSKTRGRPFIVLRVLAVYGRDAWAACLAEIGAYLYNDRMTVIVTPTESTYGLAHVISVSPDFERVDELIELLDAMWVAHLAHVSDANGYVTTITAVITLPQPVHFVAITAEVTTAEVTLPQPGRPDLSDE